MRVRVTDGRIELLAPVTITGAGITISRPKGYVWHAGKWPARVYHPSPAMIAASFFHDAAYEDLPWDAPSLARADHGFVEVYVSEGGSPAYAALCWIILRMWSRWTAWRRIKPL